MASGRAPTVSVVIPAYNQARYLAEAIESVLAGSYRDFEIIVVDDGSTDETPQVAQGYGGQVRYIRQANQGLAGARNTGIRAAQGELVGLLDSDDQWLPDYLEKMVALAGSNPGASVFYCSVWYIDPQGRGLPQAPDSQPLPSPRLYQVMLRYNSLVPSTILMRRAQVEAAGLFDPAFRRLQDWELWQRMLRDGRRFVGTPERLVRYRLHGESLSADPSGGQQAARAMARKLFGPPDGDPQGWTPDKRRAYGGVYRYHALTSVQYRADWSAAAGYLRQALVCDPSLGRDARLFYELALGAQPLGYRGAERQAALDENAARLLEALGRAFTPPLPPGLGRAQAQVYARAYWSLGEAAYVGRQYGRSRRFFWQALRCRPGLIADRTFSLSLIKAALGRSVLDRARRLRQALRPAFKPRGTG